MTKYYSLFAGTTTDTEVQVVKENQLLIYFGCGMTQSQYVVYKVEHSRWGYSYHFINLETKAFSQTDIVKPISQKFGIGTYYDDKDPQFMTDTQVAELKEQADECKAKEDADRRTAKAEHDRIAEIGAQRLREIMPQDVQGVIVAKCNETEYTDPSYECTSTTSTRTVILGFSDTSRNCFSELRKVARNFAETAHLAEPNKDYEHREYSFILGKNPRYGWSITKMTHYTYKGFMDALSYTAGCDDSVHLSKLSTADAPHKPETTATGEFEIVNYSEKSIAVFGDTKPIKDELCAIGGRFNSHLTYEGEKKAGWVFQKSKVEPLRKLLGMTE